LTNLEIFVIIAGLFLGYFIVSKLLDKYDGASDELDTESNKDPDKYLPRTKLPEKGEDEAEEATIKTKKESYLNKHWRGEHSLSRSFWINNAALNVILAVVITYWIFVGAKTEDPVYLARVILGLSIFGYIVVYPWQVVGLWRSANNQINGTGKTFWPQTVKFLIILGILASITDLTKEHQFYKDLYHDSFVLSKEQNYNVSLRGNIIYLDGELNYGISELVEKQLAKNSNITAIVLDSDGGLLYEGSELSKLILINSLNTYTYNGCYSACTIAYVSGNKRYMSKNAQLGFHQYSYYRPQSELDKLDLFNLQKEDAKFFRKRGVTKEFINKMYQATSEDMWYPRTNELLKYGLVHKLID